MRECYCKMGDAGGCVPENKWCEQTPKTKHFQTSSFNVFPLHMENRHGLKFIVAVNNLNYIGKDGELMWKSKADFRHFKQKTMGDVLIVGATTFEKDLKGRHLPGRTTFVVGSKYRSLWEAVRDAVVEQHSPLLGTSDTEKLSTPRKIWVIGGETIYRQLLPLCEEIHMSVINDDQVGDRKFEIPDDFRGQVFTYHFEPDENKQNGN